MSINMEEVRSRLLVLVPDYELDDAKYARKARMVAESMNLDMVFLGMIQSRETEAQLRRKLIMLSGIAGISGTNSLFRTFSCPNWLEITAQVFKPGDSIYCPEEMTVLKSFSNAGETMQTRYGEKLILAHGMVSPLNKHRFEEISLQVLNWIVILIILAAGFGLEASFDSQTAGFNRILGEIVLVGLEVFFLSFWFRFFHKLHN